MPKSNDDRLTDLEARMDQLQAEQILFASDVAKLPEAIGLNFRIFRRDLEHKIGALDRKLEDKVGKLEEKFGGLEKKVDRLEEKSDAMGADISAILDILGRHFGPKQ